MSRQTPAQDPVEHAYEGNADPYAGGRADGFSATGPTSYDRSVRGNPEINVCGCI